MSSSWTEDTLIIQNQNRLVYLLHHRFLKCPHFPKRYSPFHEHFIPVVLLRVHLIAHSSSTTDTADLSVLPPGLLFSHLPLTTLR